MRILGIDPGYDLIGFGLIEGQGSHWRFIDGGVIQTDAGNDYWQRLSNMAADLRTLLLEFRPDVCALEQLFLTKNVKTAMRVAQARGVIGLTMCQAGLAIFEYTPTQVKAAIVGNGRADKAAMQAMIKLTLGLDGLPRPDDFADALGVALCHGQFRLLTEVA